jgi:hypothetical protein
MRKSRRWLLASLGASAVARVARAQAPPSAPKPQPFVSPCESTAVPVPELSGYIGVVPGSVADAKTALLEVFAAGLHYGGHEDLDNSRFEEHLRRAYDDSTLADFQRSWCLLVIQAHVLGQLTQYSWRRRTASPKPDSLRFRHLGEAWALFHRALSAAECDQFIQKKFYVLPQVPALDVCKNLVGLDGRVRQIGQPCALCT